MARVSPHESATSEYRLRNLTTILYVAVVGGVICIAYWILGPAQTPPDLPTDSETARQSTSHSNDIKPEASTLVAEAVLSDQVDAIQEQLSTSSSPETSALMTQLGVLAERLHTVKLRPAELAQIENRLAHLQEQASLYQAQAQRPVVNSDSLLSAVDAIALKLAEDNERETAMAITDAEQELRHRLDPDIRSVRLEVRDSRDQITRLQQQIAQEQREQTQQREKAEREKALADVMPDIRKYLSPFITPGYLQPKAGSNPWNTERTVDAQPVSLARLKKAGALDRTMKGLERLYIFGGGKNPGLRNERPLGAFPEYFAEQLHKPQVRDAVERAQALLIQHGEALVEQQLLSP